MCNICPIKSFTKTKDNYKKKQIKPKKKQFLCGIWQKPCKSWPFFGFICHFPGGLFWWKKIQKTAALFSKTKMYTKTMVFTFNDLPKPNWIFESSKTSQLTTLGMHGHFPKWYNVSSINTNKPCKRHHWLDSHNSTLLLNLFATK